MTRKFSVPVSDVMIERINSDSKEKGYGTQKAWFLGEVEKIFSGNANANLEDEIEEKKRKISVLQKKISIIERSKFNRAGLQKVAERINDIENRLRQRRQKIDFELLEDQKELRNIQEMIKQEMLGI